MNEENISNDDQEASSNNTFDLALRPKKLNDKFDLSLSLCLILRKIFRYF